MEIKQIEKRMSKIEAKLGASAELMSVKQLSEYIGLREDYIHRLTSKRILPHYVPFGKKIYFKKSEIDEYIKKHRVLTESEIQGEATNQSLKTKA